MDEIPFVHIFASRNQFSSADELARFVDPHYSDDGMLLPSRFMTEIGLESFEPEAIEREFYERPKDLLSVLPEFSYADQFRLVRMESTSIDAIICVYAPNVARTPHRSSLDYVGAFRYIPNQE